MYELFYNFTAEPFRLSPDHRFCFEHNSYGKARAYLAYAFKRAEGFVMITGRPGTGKTTLIGELVESLSTDKVVTANLVCTQLQADDLLKTVAYSFGISPAQVGKAELLQHLNSLLHRWHREGRRALLVVDEAQDLSSSAMEELRLLTNIQFNGQPLLQIFLLGQPELRDLILSPGMEQVHQRIVAASHIEGLEEDETEAYVIHRLSRVGWKGDPAIDRAIFPLIHRFSEGVPRRINLICSRLFLLGSVEERHAIEVKDVSVVIGELQAENLAAGTGISREHFQNSAEPDWVAIPDAEQQETAAPHLQAAGTPSATTVEADSADKSAELKKKDIPKSEPVAEPAGNRESGDDSESPNESHPETGSKNDTDSPAVPPPLDKVEAASTDSVDSLAQKPQVSIPEPEPEPEPEPGLEPEHGLDPVPDDALVAGHKSDSATARPAMSYNQDDLAASGALQENNFVPEGGGEMVSPAPRRRFMLMALLMLAAIALALLLKACFVPGDDWSFLDRQMQPPTRGDSVLVATVSQADRRDIAVAAQASELAPQKPSAKPEKTSNPAPVAAGSVEKRAALKPIVVDANTLPSIQVTAADDDGLSVESLARPQRDGEKTRVRAGEEVSLVDSTDPGASNTWQETILIPFSFDSDDLVPDSRDVLDKAAEMLRENDSSEAAITGFTDSQGDSQYNLELSRKRADAVERYLVGAGIAPERLHVEGRGVLHDPVEGLASGLEDPMEPYRIVQITVVGEG
tara:strand:+ start:2343 stop:4580 length:2238 start_codon:yes stop_codon:yes gene_type:complete